MDASCNRACSLDLRNFQKHFFIQTEVSIVTRIATQCQNPGWRKRIDKEFANIPH
jgi:hypothetical protein